MSETQTKFTPAQVRSALAECRHLWAVYCSSPEDERIELLEAHCVKLCGGDVELGKELCTTALWGG